MGSNRFVFQHIILLGKKTMSMGTEFKEFSIKGNSVDMAIGIVIGVAFGKVVSSFVNDVVMPPIGLLIGGVDFNKLALTLKEASDDVTAIAFFLWQFIQTTLDFIIIAFVIFMMIRAINSQKLKQGEVVPLPRLCLPKKSCCFLIYETYYKIQEKRQIFMLIL